MGVVFLINISNGLVTLAVHLIPVYGQKAFQQPVIIALGWVGFTHKLIYQRLESILFIWYYRLHYSGCKYVWLLRKALYKYITVTTQMFISQQHTRIYCSFCPALCLLQHLIYTLTAHCWYCYNVKQRFCHA